MLIHVEPLFSFQLIFQYQAQDDADNADDDTAEKGIPEDGWGDKQVNIEALPDDAGQPEEEGIDQQGEETQCQDNEGASQHFDERAYQRVDQAKDERQPDY